MSLIWYDPFECPARPSRLLDQHFGMGLEPEDLLAPLVPPREMIRHHPLLRSPAAAGGYYRPWRTVASHHDTGSTVKFDKDHFEANLDVQQFRPEEITVKVTGNNTVTIEGKHEEKQDEHGYISRHFVRKYVLPKGHNIDKLESKLSSDGVLTITAPKIDAPDAGHRTVPIKHTGQPSRPAVVEKNKEEAKEKKTDAEKKK